MFKYSSIPIIFIIFSLCATCVFHPEGGVDPPTASIFPESPILRSTLSLLRCCSGWGRPLRRLPVPPPQAGGGGADRMAGIPNSSDGFPRPSHGAAAHLSLGGAALPAWTTLRRSHARAVSLAARDLSTHQRPLAQCLGRRVLPKVLLREARGSCVFVFDCVCVLLFFLRLSKCMSRLDNSPQFH